MLPCEFELGSCVLELGSETLQRRHVALTLAVRPLGSPAYPALHAHPDIVVVAGGEYCHVCVYVCMYMYMYM